MNDTPETPKLSWWRRLSSGLKRTSSSLGTAVADLVTKRKLDRAMLDDIEVSARARASGIVSAYSQHYLDKKLRSMQVLEHDRLLGRLEPATAAINGDSDPGTEPGTEEMA